MGPIAAARCASSAAAAAAAGSEDLLGESIPKVLDLRVDGEIPLEEPVTREDLFQVRGRIKAIFQGSMYASVGQRHPENRSASAYLL